MAAKSEQTRQKLAEVALRMFREIGFEKTTMRAIAAEAGVSAGNAYYYFESKDDLVHELYVQVQAEHAERAAGALDTTGGLAERLKAVLHTGLDVMAPYHRFGADFVATAIRPTSPVNPFSTASTPAREASLEIFRQAVDGARPAVPKKLRSDLPELLWLCYMGVTLFWVYDTSDGQQRTRRLVDGAAPLIARGLGLARVPGVGKVLDDVLNLSRSVRSQAGGNT
ncbi:transcriptional regulator, TetR family [Pseudarthrobacter chlorophenolicus A6]|uniref:Transcriptional regulator, TetR family n=1 Tax=Pseudarthrobacter chlorophenolicus (strain ATCC 700700 / DSM 12829 / CIP 107037 / JCM 12360 / KCTC 9906 / NCIMB 13794 / A6) TaxID=452863 RepID=B8HC11_PSECP|nr:TetR family transcriptional regulator [Pseudarthrobacter chlorophenolicus]ACL38721.1 transcriptional regulator, TetR family [Pseudarthrobacter chlorophenolicus A6]SDQ42980.1 DNA-binding transcriptional regulator, AcrR family [Pseudarthrobacter chlorophenolicus]